MKRSAAWLCARDGGPRYAREIAVVLVVKFIALMVIWSIWFSGPARKEVGGERVAERVYSSQAARPEEGATHAARP
jgi:hypothetical protein